MTGFRIKSRPLEMPRASACVRSSMASGSASEKRDRLRASYSEEYPAKAEAKTNLL
jgi:hypothetical protein